VFLFSGVGCSRPAAVPSGSTTAIEPLSKAASTGTLVAMVHGNPRDIVYFVNGVRIDPKVKVEWWRDAAIRLDLRPGFYKLSATFVARGFAPDVVKCRIESEQPFEVIGGRETHVEAVVEKDWRGFPTNPRIFFQEVVLEPETETAPDDRSGAVAPAADATAAAAQSEPVDLVVPGNTSEPSGDAYIRIGSAEANGATSGATETIVLSGVAAASAAPGPDSMSAASVGSQSADASSADVVPDAQGDAADAAAATLAAAAAGTVPMTLNQPQTVLIRIELLSSPAGAHVSVDGQVVGQAPVAVQLDPRYDHVVEFKRDGCGDYVRLLSALGWLEGRSPTISAELTCD
jgi:hypothetical protein